MGHLETKAVGSFSARSSLTPCILDDDPEQLNLLSEMISGMGYDALPTSDPEEALRLVQSGACKLILADVPLPGADAYAFLDRVLRVDPGVHVIIITREYTLESALEAIRRGATDFLPKPLKEVRLKPALDDVAALYDQRRRVRVREDLFYRLSSIQIRIPTLSERLEDIPLLVQFFVKKYNAAYGKSISGLTRRAQTILLQHPWPGNVRELENVIASAAITTCGDFIDLADLPENFQRPNKGADGGSEWRPLSLEEVSKVHIQKVLQMCMGNRLRAAQVLGIRRTSLYRHLKRDQAEALAHEKRRGASAGSSHTKPS